MSRRPIQDAVVNEVIARVRVHVSSTAVPEELLPRDETRELADRPVNPGAFDDAIAECKQVLQRVAERKAQVEMEEAKAASREEKQQYAAEDRARKDEEASDSMRTRVAHSVTFAADESERQRRQSIMEEQTRRDSQLAMDYAMRGSVALPRGGSLVAEARLAQLQGVTGADEATCRFFLDCAGGDVEAAKTFLEQSRA